MEGFERPKNESNKRDLDRDQRVFTEAIRSAEIGSMDIDFDEGSIEELGSELEHSGIFLLGETHGVQENADAIYSVFKKAGFRKLALEWNKDLQEPVNKFLQTGEFDFKNIQDSADGTITAGHFALLKKLKDEGLLEAVVCFDEYLESGSWDGRDERMAQNILANISKDSEPMLVVAGDLHTEVTPVSFDDKKHHPMGEHVRRQISDVPNGRIAYGSGKFHNYGVRGVLEQPGGIGLQKPRFYKSDTGMYLLELPVAHVAIVPNPSMVLVEKDTLSETATVVRGLTEKLRNLQIGDVIHYRSGAQMVVEAVEAGATGWQDGAVDGLRITADGQQYKVSVDMKTLRLAVGGSIIDIAKAD